MERAIGNLATAMRLYVEAHMRFALLFQDDPEEAINNLDMAFETKLEAFHRLYDVSKSLLDYHQHADTALIIALRNAIHHRDHPLFRSALARVYLDDGVERWQGAAFLVAHHPSLHRLPVTVRHLIRIDDLDARLNPDLASPYRDLLNETKAILRFKLIDESLKISNIRQRGARDRYPDDQIYLDVMPVVMSAVCRAFKAMKAADVAFKGFDAETYEHPFTEQIDVDLSRVTFKSLRPEDLPLYH
ncbi:hypothetical protein [Brevundimonas mediterranea]|uniref:hypothetical protein n=1 Tax=Brevundimonas mediterranea TaxID=74329 RepID=UPI004033F57D